MKYSQPTQQDLRKVLANTTAINKFKKAFYNERQNGLPSFEDIYYIIEQKKCSIGHPFYKIEHDEKISWQIFKADMQHYSRASTGFYKRLSLLNACLKRRASEPEIRAVLPMLKAESTQLSVKAASLMNRMNYYKAMLTKIELTAAPESFPNFSNNFQSVPEF